MHCNSGTHGILLGVMIALGFANIIMIIVMTIIAIAIIKAAIRRSDAKHRATTRIAVRSVYKIMDSERTAARDEEAMRAQLSAALTGSDPTQSRHLRRVANRG